MFIILKNYEKLFFNITIKKLIFVILNQSQNRIYELEILSMGIIRLNITLILNSRLRNYI